MQQKYPDWIQLIFNNPPTFQIETHNTIIM
jgi:hypothetical protein